MPFLFNIPKSGLIFNNCVIGFCKMSRNCGVEYQAFTLQLPIVENVTGDYHLNISDYGTTNLNKL